MKSYSEMLDEVRTKRVYNNSKREHLKDIATLLAMLCDEINDLNASVKDLNAGVSSLDTSVSSLG